MHKRRSGRALIASAPCSEAVDPDPQGVARHERPCACHVQIYLFGAYSCLPISVWPIVSCVCPIASSWLWRSSAFYVETTETRHIFPARLVWEHSSRLAVLRKEKVKKKKEAGKPGNESKRMALHLRPVCSYCIMHSTEPLSGRPQTPNLGPWQNTSKKRIPHSHKGVLQSTEPGHPLDKNTERFKRDEGTCRLAQSYPQTGRQVYNPPETVL
jgi:hypothetical protein